MNMRSIGAMYTGTEAIISGYNLMENPVFSVWKGRDLLFSHNSTDEDKGEILLRQNLEVYAAAGNSDILKICFHPKVEKDFITNKSPVCGTMFVRCCPAMPQNYLIPAMNNEGVYMGGQVDVLQKKINELESRLKAYEDNEENDDEDSQEDQIGRINEVVNGISSIMSNPVISALLAKFFEKPNDNGAKVSGLKRVAGIDDEIEYEEALRYLKEVDSDFENDIILLAKIAKENRSQFNWLITMLRKV